MILPESSFDLGWVSAPLGLGFHICRRTMVKIRFPGPVPGSPLSGEGLVALGVQGLIQEPGGAGSLVRPGESREEKEEAPTRRTGVKREWRGEDKREGS